jgi:enterochelin esterase-like enzyme/sugar lactone lactonase YvrE
MQAARAAALVGLLLGSGTMLWAEDYVLGPDSQVQPGVPKGELTKRTWTSRIFPGTTRDYWVYVPKQYDASKPAAVMVFQDGAGYVREDGNWRVPVVFDNLIHKGEMPVTVGVFVNPGVVPAASDAALPRFNRSLEYDSVDDRYARFLLEELLPEVGKSLNLVQTGNGRAIAGASSGAICAFNVAWHRPDQWSRVFSTIGTYVGLRGGHSYPTLVRKTEPKPLRVFLQDGSNDLNIYAGNWWFANQAMLSALEFSGYDVKHVWGDGAHDGKHGGAILPDALRWLWRDYPAPVVPAGPSKQPLLTSVLLPDEPWREIGKGEGPVAALSGGEILFADGERLMKRAADGTLSLYRARSGGARALGLGPDGRLYAAQPAARRLVAWDASGQETPVAKGVAIRDFAVSRTGEIYATEEGTSRLLHWSAQGVLKATTSQVARPSGLVLVPDQTLVVVADAASPFASSLQVQPQGLGFEQPYFHLHEAEGALASEAGELAVDANGYLYVASPLGIQVCDQAGRVNGIIASPLPGRPDGLAFGGPGRDELFVTVAGRLFRRKTRARGVFAFEAPVKPNSPRL